MDYAVQVSKVPARLVDLEGRAAEVSFFLHETSSHGWGAETLGERLNEEGTRFLPCEIDGRVELFQLDFLAYVELAEAPDVVRRLEETGAHRQPVTLKLRSGEALAGDLLYEAPTSAARVSDYLNQAGPRFLVLTGGSTVHFINRAAIFRVRP